MENLLSRDLNHILEHTESLWQEARGQRIFITGGTGFVGVWLLESLLWANRRLRLGSSGAVYGRQPADLSHIPEDYPGAPSTTDTGSGYGQAKRISEFLCSSYAQAYGFRAAIARLFAFIGPYLPLDRNYAAGNFVRDAMAGGPVEIAGDGTPYRSY